MNMRILAVLLLLITGCATKGYLGPELPASEVSTIYFYSQGRLSTRNMTVNGAAQGVFDMGVTVPAGKVDATVEYQLAVYECPMYAYNCFDEVEYGTCKFTLNTIGGREYAIEMRGAGESVWTNVYDKTSGENAGTGSCAKEQYGFHNSIMKRRSTIGQ